jgi:hypothetical protein
MSHNHQFPQAQDKIVARYVKVVPGMITGHRLHPLVDKASEQQVDWLLSSPESVFTWGRDERNAITLTRNAVDYGEEVIEIYSDIELQLFKRWNRSIIEAGLIREYNEVAPEVNTQNIVNDGLLKEVALIKSIPSMKKRLRDFTSQHALNRILELAIEADRPHSVLQVIRGRMNELKEHDSE